MRAHLFSRKSWRCSGLDNRTSRQKPSNAHISPAASRNSQTQWLKSAVDFRPPIPGPNGCGFAVRRNLDLVEERKIDGYAILDICGACPACVSDGCQSAL